MTSNGTVERPEMGGASGNAGAGVGIRGQRGALGCLGWILIVVGSLVVLFVASVITAWVMLPTLVAPEDPHWEMAEPDAHRADDIRAAMDSALGRAREEGRGEVRLSQADLNVLLAQALDRWQPEEVPVRDRPRLRFLVEDETVSLEAVGRVPEDARRIPGRLRGGLTELSLELRPRAAGDAMAMAVEGAHVGRIPLPVGLAMGLIPHIPLDPDVGFLDPARGEVLLPLEPLAGVPDLPEGVYLEALEPAAGELRLVFVRAGS